MPSPYAGVAMGRLPCSRNTQPLLPSFVAKVAACSSRFRSGMFTLTAVRRACLRIHSVDEKEDAFRDSGLHKSADFVHERYRLFFPVPVAMATSIARLRSEIAFSIA
jgi:hypothetical protein